MERYTYIHSVTAEYQTPTTDNSRHKFVEEKCITTTVMSRGRTEITFDQQKIIPASEYYKRVRKRQAENSTVKPTLRLITVGGKDICVYVMGKSRNQANFRTPRAKR